MHWRQTNDELRKRILGSIPQLGYSSLKDIECAVDGGSVTLSGEVPSYYLKQVAQTIAMRVPGVRKVRNDVSVRA